MASRPSFSNVTRKVALMGYPFVGKTSLTLRFVQGSFPDTYDTTIEDLHSKVYRMRASGGPSKTFTLRITDTAGQQEYSIFPSSCRVDVDGFVLVFSVDDRKSFEMLEIIHEKIIEVLGEEKLAMVIVGNKADTNDRRVSREEGERLAQRWKAPYVETSAKEGLHIDRIFELLLIEIEICRGNLIRPTPDNGKCSIL